jgi:uncharacterized protein (TIGR03086 family)
VALSTLAALDLASDQFRDHLAAVAPEQWTAATPCPDWDVHYLVAHVVGGNRFAAMVLEGMSSDAAMETVMSTPQLGDEPILSFGGSAVEQRRLFQDAVARHQLVSHPLGDLDAERFLAMRVFDIALHAWDLAVAVGRNGDLGSPLAEHVLNIVERGAPGMGFGIEPCGDVSPQATSMERLLDLCGRCEQQVDA